MRKVIIAGILVLVVLGCVLAAGCTTVSTTDSGNLSSASGTTGDILGGPVDFDTPVEVIDSTAVKQATFTIVESMGGKNYDDMIYRNATITADVGTPFKITNTYMLGMRCNKFTTNIITFNYIENGQEKNVTVTGTVDWQKIKDNIGYTRDSSSDISEFYSKFIYKNASKYNTDGLYCAGDGIIVTAGMDGKTYYI